MVYGAKVSGRLEQKIIPNAVSATAVLAPADDLTVAGGIYQIDLYVDSIPNADEAIAQILTLEQKEPDLKFLYINPDPKTKMITIQFCDTGPGQFSFTGLLSSMPFLLGLVFVGVIAYVLWTVYSSNPIILWLLLALGAGVAFFYFTSTQIRPSSQAIFTPKSGGGRESATTEQRETNLRKSLDEYDKQIDRSERLIQNYNAEIERARKSGNAGTLDAAHSKYDKMIDSEQGRITKSEQKRDEILDKLSRL